MEGGDQLFSILQVSEKLKIPKHTLRFWEKELNGLLVPSRTNGGQRRYTVRNLAVLEEIKRCRGMGLSLPEIIERIGSVDEAGTPQMRAIERLAHRVAEVVKAEVNNFFKSQKAEEGPGPTNPGSGGS
jgi:DNA-binding transcriptional MerR regulator